MPQEQKFFSSFDTEEKKPSQPQAQTYYHAREGSEEFVENFSSHKLDLVFVLDSQEGMQRFLKQKNLFGSDFFKTVRSL